MKLSEVTPETLASHIRTDPDDALLLVYWDAAKSYTLGYTGLTEEKADEYPDLTVAALILASDLYDNRQVSISGDRVNRVNTVFESFVAAHDFNLLPSGGGE